LTSREDHRGCNTGEEGTPMLRVVTDNEGRAEMRSALDEIVLEGAQRMLAAALEAEVDAYVTALVDQRDERGRRLVVRNGHAEPRTVTTAAGPSRRTRLGSRTAALTTTPASAAGSAAPSDEGRSELALGQPALKPTHFCHLSRLGKLRTHFRPILGADSEIRS
jgi:hypothetical protein